MKKNLLLVTNPDHDMPEEDQTLAKELRGEFNVEISTPTEVSKLFKEYDACLIRNAWPSTSFEKEFDQIKQVSEKEKKRVYNPFHKKDAYIADKTYLRTLYLRGFPVIPTALTLKETAQIGNMEEWIIKPLNGISSSGFRKISWKELQTIDLHHYVIQPQIDFLQEVSFYYIDNRFMYATASAGPNRRWELSEYIPSKDQVIWADQFIAWNQLPYGIQRIDACEKEDGTLLLMEVENIMPVLSLEILKLETKNFFINQLIYSLKKHLF